jgi:hypothetical protein
MQYFAQTFSWRIRIGHQDHDDKFDDDGLLDLEILSRNIHPTYDNESAYFDIAIFETSKLSFSKVNKLLSRICAGQIQPNMQLSTPFPVMGTIFFIEYGL